MTVEWKGGRPMKFKSVKELQKQIDAYFESCYEEIWKDEPKRDDKGNKVSIKGKLQYEPVKIRRLKQIPTISGLAVALDTSRQTLINYEERWEFFDTIKRAKQFIESLIEEWALMNSLNPTSAIFNLKNNFNRKDKTEVDQTSNVNLNINWILDEIIQ